jgi:hypothetical protein
VTAALVACATRSRCATPTARSGRRSERAGHEPPPASPGRVPENGSEVEK